MTQVPRTGSGDVGAVQANGTLIPFENTVGCTLANGTTYYFPCGDADSSLKHIHIKWDAAVIVTFTFWESCFPKNLVGMGAGGTDTSDFDQGKGNWIQINPSTAYIGNASDDGTTGGSTITNATIAVAGGTAGGAVIDIGNTGAKRIRVRAAVAGTGGKVRVVCHGKD